MWVGRMRKTWTLNFTKRLCPMVVSRVWRTSGLAATDDIRLGATIITTTTTHRFRQYHNPPRSQFSNPNHT